MVSRVVWFGSSPTPSPLSRKQAVSLSQSSCVSPVELTDWKGGGGEQIHMTTRKPGPLEIIQYFMVNIPIDFI